MKILSWISLCGTSVLSSYPSVTDQLEEIIIPIPTSPQYGYKMQTRYRGGNTISQWTSFGILTTSDTVTRETIESTELSFEGPRNILQAFFPSTTPRNVHQNLMNESEYSEFVERNPDHQPIRATRAVLSIADGRIILNPTSAESYVANNHIGYARLRSPTDMIYVFGNVNWYSGALSENSEQPATSGRGPSQIMTAPRPFLFNLTSTINTVPEHILVQLEGFISRIDPNTSVGWIDENMVRWIRFQCTPALIAQLPTLVYTFTNPSDPRPTDQFSVRIQMFPEDYLQIDSSTGWCDTRIRSGSIGADIRVSQLGLPFAQVTTIVYDTNRVGFGEPINL